MSRAADALLPWTPTAGDPFDVAKAAHLFRRAAFGADPETVRAAVKEGPEATVRKLLAGVPDEDDPDARSALAIGETASHGTDIAPLRAAWTLRLLVARDALRERLTLFFHGHFATGNAKVRSPRLMWGQHLAIRRDALGKFRGLLHAMTMDPAMLVYLDGRENRKGHPNENYAREIFELFTLGVGRYTEHDIREAARALTGIAIEEGNGVFVPARHDASAKTIFGREGEFEPPDVVRLTLDRSETAEFLARKLARYFLADEPDEAVVAALAEVYYRSEYDASALAGTILRSRVFYSDACRGARVRGPVELVAGAARSLGVATFPPNDAARALDEMGQSLFDPPNVKGWDGGRSWITVATWLRRLRFAADLAASKGFDPARLGGGDDDAATARALLDHLAPCGSRADLVERTVAAARGAGGDDAARARAAARFVLSLPETQLG